MDERDRKHRSAANAVGGSTARACDGCLRRRARWYCGADDAFLCQACDSSVHSANSLARRHQRLRLHTASFSSSPSPSPSPTPPPISWRKRKARTPRGHHQPKSVKPEPLVPDLEKEEEELEMQLMFCVPVLDPLFNDFSSASLEAKPMSNYGLDTGPGPSIEMDMENLDVECLLGVGLDDVHESSLYIDGFTAVDEEDVSRIKMEFEYDAMGDEMELCHEAQGVVAVEERKEREELGEGIVKKMGLRLDYDAVIDAWSRSGCSPWAGGDRPQLDSDGYLPSLMGLSQGGASWSRGRWGASGGEEREARVTRYREKRRTRLFSKKIRYEVRKLNAEKRPRMKGRFVKRTTLSAGPGQKAPYGQY